MSMIWLTSSSANSSALSFLVLYFLHFWRVILPKIQMNALTHGVFKHKLSRCAVRQNFDSIIITTTITSITIIIIIIIIIITIIMTSITIITITITIITIIIIIITTITCITIITIIIIIITTITSITIIIIIITIITCITIITITITTIIFITTIAKGIIINKPSIPVISLMYFSSLRSFAAIERQSSKSFK